MKIRDNLKVAGAQQTHMEDPITFTALTPWPGDLVRAGEFTRFGQHFFFTFSM